MGNAFRSDPDVALMLAVKGGDHAAFEKLVARHATPLVNLFYRQTGDRDLAEDLAQETFLKVFRARGSYEPMALFRTWLLRIATNLMLNRQRYDSHRQHLSLDAAPGREGEAFAKEVPDVRAADPAAHTERLEIHAHLRRAVLALPENQRIAVGLHRFEGLSYKEIAEAMSTTVKAVKSLLNRAKENLRERLEKEIAEEASRREAPVPEES